jgi:hypothetical protein
VDEEDLLKRRPNAHVPLVRRVTSVLAAVVAAELLARLGLAPAPHVPAVHPDLPLQSGSPTVDLPCWCTLYASRALRQPLRVHWIGPLVCSPATTSDHRRATDGLARVDAANVAPSVPIPSSFGTRATRPT